MVPPMPAAKNTRAEQTRKSNTVVPRFVSQHTAPAVLGFKTGRAFLEWLAISGCRIVERGKDRLVLLDEAEAALLKTAGGEGAASAPASDDLVTASAVLARIGRRVGGGR